MKENHVLIHFSFRNETGREDFCCGDRAVVCKCGHKGLKFVRNMREIIKGLDEELVCPGCGEVTYTRVPHRINVLKTNNTSYCCGDCRLECDECGHCGMQFVRTTEDDLEEIVCPLCGYIVKVGNLPVLVSPASHRLTIPNKSV